MATAKPKQTKAQQSKASSEHQEGPGPALQQEAIEAIKSLFGEAVKQIREARPPELGDDAQKAVAEYLKIKAALRTPESNDPIPSDQQWKLPLLNETATPDNQASESAD